MLGEQKFNLIRSKHAKQGLRASGIVEALNIFKNRELELL